MRTITIIVDDEAKKVDVVIGGQMTSLGAARMCYMAGRVFEERAKLEQLRQPAEIQNNGGDNG